MSGSRTIRARVDEECDILTGVRILTRVRGITETRRGNLQQASGLLVLIGSIFPAYVWLSHWMTIPHTMRTIFPHLWVCRIHSYRMGSLLEVVMTSSHVQLKCMK